MPCPAPSRAGPGGVGKGPRSPWSSGGLASGCPMTSQVCPGCTRVILALMGSGHALGGWDPHMASNPYKLKGGHVLAFLTKLKPSPRRISLLSQFSFSLRLVTTRAGVQLHQVLPGGTAVSPPLGRETEGFQPPEGPVCASPSPARGRHSSDCSHLAVVLLVPKPPMNGIIQHIFFGRLVFRPTQ